MAKPLVTDEFWSLVGPLLPKPKRYPKGGRPPIDNRAALTGILFVLMTGIPWRMLPQEMGCGSGMTCWRRLRDWQAVGVWTELHALSLDKLSQADKIDWSRASADSASVPAPLAKKGAVKRLGHLRRIAANRARSAILW
jgi:transposase